MGTLDIFILVILALGLLRGWTAGFLKQASSLAGTVLAFVLAASFMESVGRILELNMTLSPDKSPLLAFVIIFLVVKLAVKMVTKTAESLLNATKLSGIDRLAGGAAGAAKAAIAMSLVFVMIGYAQLPGKVSRDSSDLYMPVYSLVPEALSFLSDRSPAFEEFRQKVEDRLEFEANSIPI